MSFDIVSTAGAMPNTPGQSTNPVSILFNHTSTSNNSHTFIVDKEPVYIEAYGFGATDIATVQMVTYVGGVASYANYEPIYGVVQVTQNRTKVRIDYPGNYRLVYSGPGVAATIVTAYAGTMTHESTVDIAEALRTILSTFLITTNGAPGQSCVTQLGAAATSSGNNVTVIGGSAHGNDGCTVLGCSAGGQGIDVTVNSTGVNNTFIGFDSGGGSTGNGTTAIGQEAFLEGIGDYGTFLGGVAGRQSNGVSNIGVGNYAFSNAGAPITGSFSTAVGNQALSVTTFPGPVTSGLDYCVALGMSALMDFMGPGSPKGAIGVGAWAGHKAQYSGIFIGSNAGERNAHQNNIIIASTDPTTGTDTVATADNQMILGTASNNQLVTAGSVIQGGVITASDNRLKKNVTPLASCLDTIAKLRPVNFNWDEDKLVNAGVPYDKDTVNTLQSGLIAQEAEQVIPEVITPFRGKDGVSYLFVHYEKTIAMLIGAIQELNAEINILKSGVN